MVKPYELLESRIEDPYIREAFRRVRQHLKDLETTAGDTTNIRNTIINEIDFGDIEIDVAKLVIRKIAASNITEFQLIRLVSADEVDVASNESYNESRVVGIALETKNAGQEVKILTFGVVEDGFGYAIYTQLFLGTNGAITSTPPTATGRFVTSIGQSLGPGSIFIKIEEPEEIV